MRKFIPTHLLVLILLSASILLAGCSTAEQTPTVDEAAPAAEAQPTESPPTEAPPTKAPPTEAASTESEPADSADSGKASSVAAGAQMECTLVSDQPDIPAELAAIFGVTEDDWSKGPETAAVTIVEYGDFQ